VIWFVAPKSPTQSPATSCGRQEKTHHRVDFQIKLKLNPFPELGAVRFSKIKSGCGILPWVASANKFLFTRLGAV
jgi:hypothetical protein